MAWRHRLAGMMNPERQRAIVMVLAVVIGLSMVLSLVVPLFWQ